MRIKRGMGKNKKLKFTVWLLFFIYYFLGRKAEKQV